MCRGLSAEVGPAYTSGPSRSLSLESLWPISQPLFNLLTRFRIIFSGGNQIPPLGLAVDGFCFSKLTAHMFLAYEQNWNRIQYNYNVTTH